MSTISGISSASSAWSDMSAMRAQMKERMFAKVDKDGSGGVDKTELQGLLDDVAKKTGVTNSSTTTDQMFSKLDTNGDGSLSSDELDKGMKDILPPPPAGGGFTKAQGDSGASGSAGQDDLFGKVDTDGDGLVSKVEMQIFMAKMASAGGSDSASSTGTASSSSSSTDTSSTSSTSAGSSDSFASLDTNGDDSLSKAEFEAGRPGGGGRPQGAGGMPPPPPAGGGGAGGSSSTTSSSTTYDPLDTNKDGVVSIQERLAGASSTDAAQSLFKAIDTDGDSKISTSEADAFVKQLTSAADSTTTQSAQDTGTNSGSGSGSGAQSTRDFALGELARRVYEQIASGKVQSSKGSTLSTVA